MQIEVGARVEINSNRLNDFSGFQGVVAAVQVTMTENIIRSEKGRILLIEYPVQRDWEIYQVDIGSMLVACHISELKILQ